MSSVCFRSGIVCARGGIRRFSSQPPSSAKNILKRLPDELRASIADIGRYTDLKNIVEKLNAPIRRLGVVIPAKQFEERVYLLHRSLTAGKPPYKVDEQFVENNGLEVSRCSIINRGSDNPTLEISCFKGPEEDKLLGVDSSVEWLRNFLNHKSNF